MQHINRDIHIVSINPGRRHHHLATGNAYRIVQPHLHRRDIRPNVFQDHMVIVVRTDRKRNGGLFIQIRETHLNRRRLIQVLVALGHLGLIAVHGIQIQFPHHVFHIRLRLQHHHFIVHRTDNNALAHDGINCR